jgi:hypothetical protein
VTRKRTNPREQRTCVKYHIHLTSKLLSSAADVFIVTDGIKLAPSDRFSRILMVAEFLSSIRQERLSGGQSL